MSDIYGRLVEHTDVPVGQPGRFTAEIKPHDFVRKGERQLMAGRMRRVISPFCGECGYSRLSAIHPGEKA